MSRVDVVIVAYRSAAHIEACVESVIHRPAVGTVLVVDHGDDGSDEIARRVGAEVLRCPWNPGFGAGQNAGVRLTTAPFVLLFNPDARLASGALDRGVEVLDERPTVAMVQGIVRSRVTGEPERSQGRTLRPVHLVGRAMGLRRLLRHQLVRRLARRSRLLKDHADRVPDEPLPVETLASTAVLVRRSAFDAVGGFDERYFLYGEDLDLCRRLRADGWQLVTLPVEWAAHVSGASAESWPDRERRWWAGTMRYTAQWWPAGDWAIALVAAVLMWARIAVREPKRRRATWSALLTEPRAARRSLRSERRDRELGST